MGQAPDSLRDSSNASNAPRLLDQVRATIRGKHYSRRSEKTYIHSIKRLIDFTDKRHPAKLAACRT
ncbi:MAG: phage integrase N-terminal SAM-like domain-containing protein [Betaproteobacteria bacterium]|nr:phage integrase N-terminal SAM-like domain-containing protein [Betaproteobacteria bacterium]